MSKKLSGLPDYIPPPPPRDDFKEMSRLLEGAQSFSDVLIEIGQLELLKDAIDRRINRLKKGE